ncbi:MAG: BACON domain-containing protein, partial [Roseibacillus sp.]|nr:BACON domain-containing protein [Roseibacillus sp.]
MSTANLENPVGPADPNFRIVANVHPGTYLINVSYEWDEQGFFGDEPLPGTGPNQLRTSFTPGGTLSLSPETANIPPNGGNGTFTVSSNTTWDWTSSAPSWLTSNEATTQSGNQAFSYSLAANTSTQPRPATITITDGNLTRTHTVTQAGVTETDHGDTIATATPIAPNSTTAGVIDPGGDLDYFRIEVPAPGLLTVRTTGDIDTYGRLLDAAGNVLARGDLWGGWNRDGDDLNFQISYFVTRGTYFLSVSGWAGQNNSPLPGPYQLESSLQIGARDDFGNTPDEAAVISLNSVRNGTIEVDDDVDVFRIVTNTTGLLTVRTTGDTDTRGTLLNSAGTIICVDNDGEFNPFPGNEFDEENDSDLNFEIRYLVVPGTYYLEVSSDGNDGMLVTGDYQLVNSFEPGFADRHGHRIEDATGIALGSPIEGDIDYCNDIDYFRFEVATPGVLTLQEDASDGIRFLLLDDDGAEVAPGWWRIQQWVTPGTYYLAVRGAEEGLRVNLGAYRIQTFLPVPATLSLSPQSRNVGANGSTPWDASVFDISTNANWNWSSSAPWLTSTVPPSRGAVANMRFRYSVAPNTSTASRTAIITITAGNLTRTHTVTQAGVDTSLSLSSETTSIPANGGSSTFTVSSNTSWNWSDNAAWFTSNESPSQNGNQVFSYSVGRNPSTASRTATITITAGNLTRTHTVTQAGGDVTLTLNQATRSIPATGGSGTFTISSNTTWNWNSSAPWITSNESTPQSGNQLFDYLVAPNPSTTSRTGIIT